MKIRLKGDLDLDLLRLGLRDGDEVYATPDRIGTTGAMYFERIYNGFTSDCVVWPENYEIVQEQETGSNREKRKLHPDRDTLVQMGFVEKSNGGDDPRDIWYEFDLSNEQTSGNKVLLQMDAFSDFSLVIPELEEPIPLNFQSLEEVWLFLLPFRRKSNHAFSGLLDLIN